MASGSRILSHGSKTRLGERAGCQRLWPVPLVTNVYSSMLFARSKRTQKKARQQMLTSRITEGVYPVRFGRDYPNLVISILPSVITPFNCFEDIHDQCMTLSEQ